jgi:hypothetical protein
MIVGNGKSPLRMLMATFAVANGSRGFTVDEAFAGTRARGLKWERTHVRTTLNNMHTDGQLWGEWDGQQRRYYWSKPKHR